MEYKKELQELLDDANNHPCLFCGKMHHLEMEYNDAAILHILRYGFSEDACDKYRDMFKKRAELLVRSAKQAELG